MVETISPTVVIYNSEFCIAVIPTESINKVVYHVFKFKKKDLNKGRRVISSVNYFIFFLFLCVFVFSSSFYLVLSLANEVLCEIYTDARAYFYPTQMTVYKKEEFTPQYDGCFFRSLIAFFVIWNRKGKEKEGEREWNWYVIQQKKRKQNWGNWDLT